MGQTVAPSTRGELTHDFPRDPVAAVTHPDPYDYYARLVTDRPLYYDDVLRLWIASSGDVAAAVLTSSIVRVRPPSEPVPTTIAGSAAGDIFGQLVRMNDGDKHCPFKSAISRTLGSQNYAGISRVSTRCAAHLSQRVGSETDPRRLMKIAFALPVHVVATLLGIAEESLDEVTRLLADFVACVSPASTPEQIQRGNSAAGRLSVLIQTEIARTRGNVNTLLGTLEGQAAQFGEHDPATVIANAIGLMMQAYEATAGLISTTLPKLGSSPDVRQELARIPETMYSIVEEVLRYDSPVQNTRRYLAEDGPVAGTEMKRDDAVLVILAAANRDPKVNPNPDRFEIARTDRRLFTFGQGPHACPGQMLAITIAAAGVAELLARGVSPDKFALRPLFRPSANCRIPLLT